MGDSSCSGVTLLDWLDEERDDNVLVLQEEEGQEEEEEVERVGIDRRDDERVFLLFLQRNLVFCWITSVFRVMFKNGVCLLYVNE